MRKRIWGVATAAVTLLVGASSHAAIVTRQYDFSSTDYMNTGPYIPAPYNPAIGSITVTFDTSVAVTDQTSGIVINSLNVPIAGPVAFSYTPSGILYFGAILGPLDTVANVTSGTADFLAGIYDPLSNTTTWAAVQYSVAGVDTRWLPGSGRSIGTTVPEPNVWALMIMGFGFAGGGLRRRRALSV